MNDARPQDGNDSNAPEARRWVVAANKWGEASQSVVGAAADLALASRSLADAIDLAKPQGQPQRSPGQSLAGDLRVLGNEVEADTSELRDRFLTTEANLAEYRQILG